jgi:hypothetical protein
VSVVVVVAQVSEPVKMSSRGSTYWLLAFWLFFLSASWFHCVAATHTGHHGKVRARRPAPDPSHCSTIDYLNAITQDITRQWPPIPPQYSPSDEPERLFSEAGAIVGPRRRSMQASTIQQIMCLRSWRRQGLFRWSESLFDALQTTGATT